MSKGNIYYVYEHIRPDRGEVFYVGKGHGKRANNMKHRNRYHKFVQEKLARLGSAVEVKIIADGLSEDAALELEIERIAFWRADGADLVNMTSGGDGVRGYKWTAEHRQKMKKMMVVMFASPEWRAKVSAGGMGKKLSDETKAKLKVAHTGKKMSPEACAKMSAYRKGRPLKQTQKKSDALKAAWAKRKANGSFVPKPKVPKEKKWGKGFTHKPETIEKMRAAKRRWWESEEKKAAQSARMKEWWQHGDAEERKERFADLMSDRSKRLWEEKKFKRSITQEEEK